MNDGVEVLNPYRWKVCRCRAPMSPRRMTANGTLMSGFPMLDSRWRELRLGDFHQRRSRPGDHGRTVQGVRRSAQGPAEPLRGVERTDEGLLPLAGRGDAVRPGLPSRCPVKLVWTSTDTVTHFCLLHYSTFNQNLAVPSTCCMKRFLDCSTGGKIPGRSLLEVGVDQALRDGGFDQEAFDTRGGIYNWSKPAVEPQAQEPDDGKYDW